MTDEMDPARVARAREALAEWLNRLPSPFQTEKLVGDSFVGWQVGPIEEFLMFGPPSGYSNGMYLVGEGVVRAFSYGMDPLEDVVAAARAERDGLDPANG